MYILQNYTYITNRYVYITNMPVTNIYAHITSNITVNQLDSAY